ncbi:hypothetical protein A3D77_07175 [Candidatus Gottesmanbacteria bacterium RIFCSPHIGHO2_02_FULL_39_11]|uniref:DUF488 domain-containing protein n=1 Tax=Candidatus Gottesmanbacteria bacterium RIFCSPHIGHO2_02_FULL_39_11 TaxID=1798382 RepID=A0A1F5ZJZ2_9BACT|nr:MAG: hypothetical protein A3D77_07175 [Candidatus Gottesmanbacteria bacterium RIFCSPHIGHO2_02_FULL_39_11]
MTQLFTTGYQGETIHEFIQKITTKNIEAIIDIRENPTSRKPGFSKNALQRRLDSVGIDYYHFQELGTPKPLRNLLAHSQNYNQFFEEYKQFLPEFQDALDDIIEIGSNKRICLLCFEKDPHYCHRKIVANLISFYTGRDISVVHI